MAVKTSSRAITRAVVLLCAVGLTTAALWAQRGQGGGQGAGARRAAGCRRPGRCRGWPTASRI